MKKFVVCLVVLLCGFSQVKADFTSFLISADEGDELFPRVNDNIVVWENNTQHRVYAKNLSTGEKFVVTDNIAYTPDIDGNIIVWQDGRNISYNCIYGYDLSSESEFIVRDEADINLSYPAVSGDIVVWQQYYNPTQTWDIKGRYLQVGIPFDICVEIWGAQVHPAIDENIAVWRDEREVDQQWKIYGKDISTDTEFPISIHSFGNAK